MPDETSNQYALARIVPPFRPTREGDVYVVEWPRLPSRPHEKVLLVDGPFDALPEAKAAFWRDR